jgi:hypothetical protein
MQDIFGKKTTNSISRFAELFDIDQEGCGQRDYEQKVKGAVDAFRTKHLARSLPKEKREIKTTKYIVIGHDEELRKHRTMQGLECKRLNVGETFKAADILKSSLAIENAPIKYVDSNGNIFEKISLESKKGE